MNIYKFELKTLKKSLIIWAISLFITFYLLIIGIYPMFADGMKLIGDLLKTMPPEYLLVFGLDVNNMAGYSGFFSFAYIYIALMTCMMTSSFTVNIFGREKKNHCQEFLLTKPVSRNKLFMSKMWALLTCVFLSNLVIVPVSLYFFNEYSSLDKMAVLATLSITLSQIMFAGITLLITMLIPKIRSTASITASVSLIGFILEIFINSLNVRWLEFASPLHFFRPKYVFTYGHYDYTLAVYAVFILVLTVGYSYNRFIKSDLTKM